MAIVFHLRSVRDKPEPLNTGMRIVGESQVKIHKYDHQHNEKNYFETDSEDDFDLKNF